MKKQNPFDELIKLYQKEEYLLSKIRLLRKPKASDLFVKLCPMNQMEKLDWKLMSRDENIEIVYMILLFAREMWEDEKR